jgi:hypothetical protein
MLYNPHSSPSPPEPLFCVRTEFFKKKFMKMLAQLPIIIIWYVMLKDPTKIGEVFRPQKNQAPPRKSHSLLRWSVWRPATRRRNWIFFWQLYRFLWHEWHSFALFLEFFFRYIIAAPHDDTQNRDAFHKFFISCVKKSNETKSLF